MVDMVILNGHYGHMKVRIAELKTHLSSYVQSVRDSGEPIEVCVRDQSVAYLVAPGFERRDNASARYESGLESIGLILSQRGAGPLPSVVPGQAGTDRVCDNAVEDIRRERDW